MTDLDRPGLPRPRDKVAADEIVEVRRANWGPENKGMACDALAVHLGALATRVVTQMGTGAIVRSSVAELGALCIFLMEATDG